MPLSEIALQTVCPHCVELKAVTTMQAIHMMITDSANPTNAPPAALNVLITGSLATISRTFINILSKTDNPI